MAKIAASFFPLMHPALMSRSNIANSNMCMTKKPQLQRYCKLSLVCKKLHGKIYNVNYVHKGLTI